MKVLNLLVWASRYVTETGCTTEWDRIREIYEDARLMHEAWNVAEFGGELAPVPVIPLLTPYVNSYEALMGESYTLGFYSPRALGTGAIFLGVPEAVIEARQTGQTIYRSIAQTLLHEMCHQYACEHGINDVEADGIHNAAFRGIARAHGLVCHRGAWGWNRTMVRKGHWSSFYELVSFGVAHRMRVTHVASGEHA